MKKENLEVLQGKLGQEIIDDLKNCRYSLLDSIGCKELRLKMLPAGKTTALIVRHLERKTKHTRDNMLWPREFRSNIVKFLKIIAPYELNIKDGLPVNTDGMIIGFNHPSLGEILRLIALVAKHYPHANYLFPVNLPWFEALCPVMGTLESAGIILAPIITPATREKIAQIAGKDMGESADIISKAFTARYLELCRQFIRNDDIIILAPSATRQRTVFSSVDALCSREKIDPSSMSLIASMLTREAGFSETKFVPIGIRPPANFGRGLNLFLNYELGVAKPFSLQEAIALSKEKYGDFHGRKFDFEFLYRIAKKIAELGSPNLIAPFIEQYNSKNRAYFLKSTYKATV